MTENIYLVKFEPKADHLIFHILGTSKVVYKVKFPVGSKPQCTCPDHKIRKNTCKHIYFVCGKVIHIEPNDWCRVDDIVAIADAIMLDFSHLAEEHVFVDESLKKKYEEKLSSKSDVDTDTAAVNAIDIRNTECCVCLCDIETASSKDVMVCCICQNGIHSVCWNKWRQVNKNDRCVYCRSKIERLDSEINSRARSLEQHGWGILLQ